MTTRTLHRRLNGHDVHELRNDYTRICVIPSLGAKISSLRDLETRREWMWLPNGEEGFATRTPHRAYDEENLGGIDECIPTIGRCTWRGDVLPDHGEVWSQAWTLNDAALTRGQIVTRVRFPVSPFVLERSISLHDRDVHFDYTLENLSSETREYIWAFHPNFSVHPGDRIELPADCTRFQTDAVIGCDTLGPSGSAHPWPEPEPGVRLDRMDFGLHGAAAIKLFTDPLSTGYAAVQNDVSGERLALHFDATLHNTLGIWLTRGGWRGHHHLALEPTNGAPDALDIAVQRWKRFATIGPNATQHWTLRIALSHTKL